MATVLLSWLALWGTALADSLSRAHGAEPGSEGLSSMFSPRMDFDQWRPLTGRGDPLRNDPTYDYEPPVLERVTYWAQAPPAPPARPAGPRAPPAAPAARPDRKAEVLVLGVSSNKPSVAPPSHKAAPRPPLPHYEDFTYRLSELYPMTILVPPPPPAHPPALFGPPEVSPLPPVAAAPQGPSVGAPAGTITDTTLVPDHLSSFYTLQESNLIYQSSTTQNWVTSEVKPAATSAVSSDYAGWGPTSAAPPAGQASATHNLISSDYLELTHHPYVFHEAKSTQASPTPRNDSSPVLVSTFLPTVLPPTPALETSTAPAPATRPSQPSTQPMTASTEAPPPAPVGTASPAPHPAALNRDANAFDMLRPMMSMPLDNDPEGLEDNVRASASETVQVLKEQGGQSLVYVHAEGARAPTRPHLIIQGHSKVKTYGSRPRPAASRDTITNEIPKPVFSDQVKHLHSKKLAKKLDTTDVNLKSRPKNLQSLLDHGYGSIEIQETDVGIKYDVSDGGDVPVEIYRKGLVDAGSASPLRRVKRQIELEDLLPFDEDDIEEYIYKFLESKKNETGITGLIAQAVTGGRAAR